MATHDAVPYIKQGCVRKSYLVQDFQILQTWLSAFRENSVRFTHKVTKMKIKILFLIILISQSVFAWKSHRQKYNQIKSSAVEKKVMRNAAGERQLSEIREFLCNKGSLTEEEDDLLYLELSTVMKHENSQGMCMFYYTPEGLSMLPLRVEGICVPKCPP